MKTILAFVTALSLTAITAHGQIIFTIAGNGVSSSSTSDSVLATTVSVSLPHNGVFDSAGNFYFASAQNRIRKLSPDGIVTTIIGTGSSGYSGDSGLAKLAKIHCQGMYRDSAGNFFIADYYNYRIRKVDASTGIITTIAGNGTSTISGDGGPATSASTQPLDVITDDTGNIYISEGVSPVIRKISIATGIIDTFAHINGFLCFDPNYHTMYVGAGARVITIDMSTRMLDTIAGIGIGGYNGDEIPAITAKFTVIDITVDNSGNIFIADHGTDRIRKIDAAGIIHTVAGTGVAAYNGDSLVATTAQLHDPQGVAVDKCGNLYIADDNNHRIRKVDFNPTCAPIVGVQAVQQAVGEVSVSPNPAYDEVTITAGTTLHSITISNIAGQVVYTTTPTSKTTTLNIAHLPAGIYILRADGVVKRVVKG